jgi:hypothetical protein
MLFGSDKEQKRRLKKSRKQEKRTADRYKGSRNAGSGAGWMRKNDVRTDKLLIENKFTDNVKGYSVKVKDMNELRKQALMEDRIPVLQIEIGGVRFITMYEDDFMEYFNG